MRKLNFLFYTLIAAVLIQCSDDDKKSFTFKDQDVSGRISNTAWTYADGYADTYANQEEELMISVKLTLTQDQPGCEMGLPVGDQIFFDVPATPGVYKLFLDLESGDGQTVTLWDDSEELNILASKGAIEILEITETEVTGRIDARSSSDSYVNGNFTIDICTVQ
jgi:hypothetical protein